MSHKESTWSSNPGANLSLIFYKSAFLIPIADRVSTMTVRQAIIREGRAATAEVRILGDILILQQLGWLAASFEDRAMKEENGRARAARFLRLEGAGQAAPRWRFRRNSASHFSSSGLSLVAARICRAPRPSWSSSGIPTWYLLRGPC
jgi:hypothetical protein